MSFLRKNPKLCEQIETMQAMAVNIESIQYLPVLDPYQSYEEIGEMFEDMSESNAIFIEQQYAGFNAFIKQFEDASRSQYKELVGEFISTLHQQCEYPFLIKIKLCQNIRSVSHDSKGEINGFGGAWNSYSNEWFFANSIEHAIEIATERGRKNLLRHQTVLSAS